MWSVLTFSFMGLLAVIGGVSAWYVKIRADDLKRLEAIGKGLEAECKKQVISILPQLFMPPASMSSCAEIRKAGRWPWQKQRIVRLIVVNLLCCDHARRLAPMINQCGEEYKSSLSRQDFDIFITLTYSTSTQAQA